MIRNYNLGTALSELAKPTAIGKGYFNNNDAGFTLDYLYGPYDTPENGGLLQFTYEDEDENIITRPNADLDGPSGEDGVWHLAEEIPVYNTRLDYQKALAEQMLTDVKQFFPGKKVAFIDDYGNPIEYVVIPRTEEGYENELYFEDARLVDMYKVSFDSLEAQGAQNPVEVVSRYYTLPKSEFITPDGGIDNAGHPMIFGGWVFGKQVAEGGVELLGPTYSVGQAVDLAQICTDYGIKKTEVKFYATYITSCSVMVDFENGYYNGQSFVSFDGNPDKSGYLKIQDGESQDNEQPADWDTAYSSYFTRGDEFSGGYEDDERCTYYARDWYWPWQKMKGSGVETVQACKWTAAHFGEWFPNAYEGSFNQWFPNKSANMSGDSAPEYVYVGTITEVEKDQFKAVSWYKLEKGVGRSFYYTPCEANYNNYRQVDLYTQVVHDSYTMFNNGELYGNVVYDCFADDMYTAYHGLTLQLNTEMRPFYSKKYEFDRWEIVPKKYSDNQQGGEYVEIQGAKYSDNCKYATVRLDSTYEETEGADTVSVPAEVYVFRAVYRVREGFYAKLSIANNYIDSLDNCPKGNVVVRGTVENMRGDKLNVTIGTLAYDGSFTMSDNINVSNNIEAAEQLTEDGYRVISMDPRFVLSFTLTPVPVNIQNDEFYAWTGDVTEVSRLSHQTGRSVESDGDYRYKAWFVHKGDASAKVRVTKRLSTPQTNVVQGFKGSDVAIYGWKLVNNTDGSSSESHGIISELAYMYDKSSVFEGAVVPITNTGMFAIGQPTNTDSEQTGSALTPVAVWGMGIDEDNELGNPAVIQIDETHHGYCYVKAEEATDGARFLAWSDGDTNPVKLVDVTMPTLYEMTAIFQGEPVTVDDMPDSAVASDLASFDWESSIHGGGNGSQTNVWYQTEAVANNLKDNLLTVEIAENKSMFVTVPGIGLSQTPKLISEFADVERILKDKTPTAEPTTVSTVYDYNGNQYRETAVETGKSVELK